MIWKSLRTAECSKQIVLFELKHSGFSSAHFAAIHRISLKIFVKTYNYSLSLGNVKNCENVHFFKKFCIKFL